MDNSVISYPAAMVAYANWFQFGAGQTMNWPMVQSRALIWVQSGKGRIQSCGQKLELTPGDFVFLPWRHDITYQAHPRNPFLISAIHVIPVQEEDHEIVFRVAHGADPSEVYPGRRDLPIRGLEAPIKGSFADLQRLKGFCEFILSNFTIREPNRETMGPLGNLLLQEFYRLVNEPTPATPGHPPELRRLLLYIDQHLHQPLKIEELIDVSQLSPSTIGRLFRRYLSSTPSQWIIQERMIRAAQMLRTTRLNIADVASRVGYEDAFYFSRSFSKHHGVSPSEYRRQTGVI